MALLEVIALTAQDARAAEAGGADRLEVVADMAADGLTPDPEVVAEMRRATSLPMRVMLRANAGFRTTAPELDRLRRAAEDLAEAGADGFVLGFLDPFGVVDAGSVGKLVSTLPDELPWTFHRALDHAADPGAGWAAVRMLGCDAVLTAGSARGVESGLDVLVRRAAEGPASARLLMAGGGLRRKHVAALAAAGVGAFHVGTAVRPDRSWDAPIDASLVAEWRSLVTAASA
ncbi:copper homeostasis protein CutC [Spirillospora sp. NPDC052269]